MVEYAPSTESSEYGDRYTLQHLLAKFRICLNVPFFFKKIIARVRVCEEIVRVLESCRQKLGGAGATAVVETATPYSIRTANFKPSVFCSLMLHAR
jgi:hypothetical protein